MAKRKAMSQTLRFEVFKRDSFTCQYCGAKAPEAILEVDHINPVAKGGDNSIENLVTACKDCNRGKRDRKLSDMSEIEKSRRQLEELQERKNMIDMIFQWKESLYDECEETAIKIDQIFAQRTCRRFSESKIKEIQNGIKKFGLNIMIDALYASIDNYYDGSKESAEKVAGKYIGIAYNMFNDNNNPKKSSITYIRNTLAKNCRYFNMKKFYTSFPAWYDIEYKEIFLDIARKSNSLTEFLESVEEVHHG